MAKATAQSKYAKSEKGKAYRKAWLEAHPGYMRDAGMSHHLRSKYGMTVADYDRMMVAQGGVCAICRRPETARHNGSVKRLAVDHCHASGRVRGLLCFNCNYAVGHMGEDPLRLRAAASYIEAHSNGEG